MSQLDGQVSARNVSEENTILLGKEPFPRAEPVGLHGASWIAKLEHGREVTLGMQGPGD